MSTSASGTFTIGGDLTVNRLGFGSMQLPGPGVWGDPKDPDEAVRVLRRAVELGVNFIDTAQAYGPGVAERLIRTALHPYDGLVIATKVGLARPGPNRWTTDGRPETLRKWAEESLANLGVQRIDLLQLHRIDNRVPLADQIGVFTDLQKQGKVWHIGLSEVTIAQLEAALVMAPIVTVQNLYNLSNRTADGLVDHAARHDIGFIPWFPLATGKLAREQSAVAAIARRIGISPSQLALAWLLKRSPTMLPIPGTSSVAHVEENIAAAEVVLSDDDFAAVGAAVG